MTHDERVWELYKLFTAAGFNADFFGTFDEDSQQDEFAEQEDFAEKYYATAENFATAFERLTTESEERTRTDSPLENRVPDYEVTAKEG